MRGNWSARDGGTASVSGGIEGEEPEPGSGYGSGHGGSERGEGGAMLNAIWETEGLQTVGIVVLLCASIKLLHLLGLINFSEGKTLTRDRVRGRGRKKEGGKKRPRGKSCTSEENK